MKNIAKSSDMFISLALMSMPLPVLSGVVTQAPLGVSAVPGAKILPVNAVHAQPSFGSTRFFHAPSGSRGFPGSHNLRWTSDLPSAWRRNSRVSGPAVEAVQTVAEVAVAPMVDAVPFGPAPARRSAQGRPAGESPAALTTLQDLAGSKSLTGSLDGAVAANLDAGRVFENSGEQPSATEPVFLGEGTDAPKLTYSPSLSSEAKEFIKRVGGAKILFTFRDGDIYQLTFEKNRLGIITARYVEDNGKQVYSNMELSEAFDNITGAKYIVAFKDRTSAAGTFKFEAKILIPLKDLSAMEPVPSYADLRWGYFKPALLFSEAQTTN